LDKINYKLLFFLSVVFNFFLLTVFIFQNNSATEPVDLSVDKVDKIDVATERSTPQDVKKSVKVYDEFTGPPAPKDLPPSNIYYYSKIKRGETFSKSILKFDKVTPGTVDAVVKSLKNIFSFRNSFAGHSYVLEMTPDKKHVVSFTYKVNRLLSYRSEMSKGVFKGRKIEKKTEKRVEYVEGTVTNSVYDSFLKMGETSYLTVEFRKMFEYDIDFYSESHPGDKFGIVVEKEYLAGEMVRYGDVLYGYYEGKVTGSQEGYHFKSKNKKINGYYNKKGRYTKKVMLRTPVETCNTTSAYGWRKHPVTKKKHFHNGIDYRGRIGTSVYAVAEGKVLFAGRKGASGKLIVIKHSGMSLTSVYAHLSKIYVKKGQKVKQRKTIGAIGNTGRSTGPHLHFGLYTGRFSLGSKRNKHINPSKKNLVPRLKLQKKYMSEFRKFVKKIDNLIKEKKSTGLI